MLARLAGSWWARLAITAAILAYLATRIDMAAAARAVRRRSAGRTCCSCSRWSPSIAR